MRVKDPLKWVAAVFALVATASAEYEIARAIGMHQAVAVAVPGALDAYVVRALVARREVLTAVLAMVGVNAASHLVSVGILPVGWQLVTAVAAIAPLVLWRVHALSTPGEVRRRALWGVPAPSTEASTDVVTCSWCGWASCPAELLDEHKLSTCRNRFEHRDVEPDPWLPVTDTAGNTVGFVTEEPEHASTEAIWSASPSPSPSPSTGTVGDGDGMDEFLGLLYSDTDLMAVADAVSAPVPPTAPPVIRLVKDPGEVRDLKPWAKVPRPDTCQCEHGPDRHNEHGCYEFLCPCLWARSTLEHTPVTAQELVSQGVLHPSDTDTYERAREHSAGTDTVPGVRALKSELGMGTSRAQRVRAALLIEHEQRNGKGTS